MLISVEIPDMMAQQLRLDGPQPTRRALEMLALEGYRSGDLSHGQFAELLGLDFHEAEAFLVEHEATLGYSTADLDQDAESLREFFSR